jgi:hypothetical protein
MAPVWVNKTGFSVIFLCFLHDETQEKTWKRPRKTKFIIVIGPKDR